MDRKFIADKLGLYSLDIEATSGLMREALDHHMAEALLLCAMNLVVGALVQGDHWPGTCMHNLRVCAMEMKHCLVPDPRE